MRARARARVLIGFANSVHWKELESWRPKHCSPVHKRPCSLIKTSDRIKRDSLIAKGFIFEVTEAKRSREDGDNNQSTRAARWTLDRVTRLNYLVAKKKVNIAWTITYELSFLSLLIYSCTAVSYPNIFSLTCLVTYRDSPRSIEAIQHMILAPDLTFLNPLSGFVPCSLIFQPSSVNLKDTESVCYDRPLVFHGFLILALLGVTCVMTSRAVSRSFIEICSSEMKI